MALYIIPKNGIFYFRPRVFKINKLFYILKLPLIFNIIQSLFLQKPTLQKITSRQISRFKKIVETDITLICVSHTIPDIRVVRFFYEFCNKYPHNRIIKNNIKMFNVTKAFIAKSVNCTITFKICSTEIMLQDHGQWS